MGMGYGHDHYIPTYERTVTYNDLERLIYPGVNYIIGQQYFMCLWHQGWYETNNTHKIHA